MSRKGTDEYSPKIYGWPYRHLFPLAWKCKEDKQVHFKIQISCLQYPSDAFDSLLSKLFASIKAWEDPGIMG